MDQYPDINKCRRDPPSTEYYLFYVIYLGAVHIVLLHSIHGIRWETVKKVPGGTPMDNVTELLHLSIGE